MTAIPHQIHHGVSTMLVLALALFLFSADASAEAAGKFQFVAGDVRIVATTGEERKPVKGDEFSAGERILTGANGMAQLRMRDGGFIAVRANTDMRLDEFIFNGEEDGQERSLITLLQGGFRAITGLIGRTNKENYAIHTPTATIGIRGTDHEPVVVLAGDPNGFEEGTYERVYRGAVILRNDLGDLIITKDQAAFVGKGRQPTLLRKPPDFYTMAPARGNESGKESEDTGGGNRVSTKNQSIDDVEIESAEIEDVKERTLANKSALVTSKPADERSPLTPLNAPSTPAALTPLDDGPPGLVGTQESSLRNYMSTIDRATGLKFNPGEHDSRFNSSGHGNARTQLRLQQIDIVETKTDDGDKAFILKRTNSLRVLGDDLEKTKSIRIDDIRDIEAALNKFGVSDLCFANKCNSHANNIDKDHDNNKNKNK